MKLTQLFTKTLRNAPKDETSINAQLLVRAGFVSKLISGVYSYLPLGFRVLKKIEEIIRSQMLQIGGQEVLLPALHPKKNWLQTERWEIMDDLYKLKDKSGREFALGPTHEEVIVPLMKGYVSSYRDLPLYVFQIQNKFRMELRAKSGLLRGREFLMKDFYSFHLDEEDLESFYNRMTQVYFEIFKEVGIGEKTYLTLASGGTFSKFSHEFQTLSENGEDIIYLCPRCKLGINKELISLQKVCPQCGKSHFEIKKTVEVGNIFKLYDKFTKPFDFKVKNQKGEEILVLMGCYGIGLGRLMGAIVEVNHDKRGIIWPSKVAPYQIYLIGLEGAEKETEKVYQEFRKKGIEVLWDDREESAGNKFTDSDLVGLPIRLVISPKTLRDKKAEIKYRQNGKIEFISLKNISQNIPKILNRIGNS